MFLRCRPLLFSKKLFVIFREGQEEEILYDNYGSGELFLKLIGLTGGPGCGKSAVLRIFASFTSWKVFDADAICHELYAEKNSVFTEWIAMRWGKDFICEDGTLDRAKIAEKVFSDKKELAWLNGLVHPEIMRRIEHGIDMCGCQDYAMIDAPLLFEAGWNKFLQLTIAVWSSPEIQMGRLLARGWTKEHAESRIAAQLPAQEKLERADYGIINNASLDILREQCVKLNNKIS